MNDMITSLVSIVTPAYNEEEFLSECIESVLAQTYQNWDFTIVDNCSTDRTFSIAQSYAARDQRIRVIRNDKLIPAIANFNLAFRQISGTSKYCKMVLADDWMFPECLARMVAILEEHPSAGIAGAYGLADPWVLWVGLPYPSHLVSGRELCRQRLLGGPYVFGSPTSVMFRSDLVRQRDPFYDEGNDHCDSETCFELLKSCDFAFVHQVLTYSRDDRPNSRLQNSRMLNSAAASVLHELTAFGPYYLSPEEYRQHRQAAVSRYYDFLAGNVFQRRSRDFWEFHRSKLKEQGIEFSYSRLALRLARKAFNRLRLQRNGSKQAWGL